MADEMGIEFLTEEQYRASQKLREFYLKTSSSIATPAEIRKLWGSPLRRRFVYHNGASSVPCSQGLRGSLLV